MGIHAPEAPQLRKALQHVQSCSPREREKDDNRAEEEGRCVRAEKPPKVTVTLKGRRSKQHASLGHLTKVMRPMNGPDRAPLHASAADSRGAEPGPGPGPRMHPGARLHRHASDVTMAASPAQPPPRRQRSAPLRDHPPSQQHDRTFHEQPRPGQTLTCVTCQGLTP